MTKPGFLAVYRWTVEEEHCAAFEIWWRDGTDALKAHGSFGSNLAREDDGRYLGVALWPDAETRSAAFAARAGAAGASGVTAFEDVGSGTIVDMRWDPVTG